MSPLCFGIKRGEYEGRLDPQFYHPKHRELERRMRSSGFPIHRLGSPEISSHVVDGPFGSDLKVDEYVREGIPLIRVSDCRQGTIEVTDEMVFISEAKHTELIRSQVLPGDVLLTKAGAILGYSAVFPAALERGNITSHLAAIRPASGVQSAFLSEYLSSSIGMQQIYRWGNKSTRPELNTNEVRSLCVVLPTATTQAVLVAAMDTARAKRRAQLAGAKELLAGLDSFLLDALGLTPPPEDGRRVFVLRYAQARAEGRLNSEYYHPERILALRALDAAARRLTILPLSDVVTFERRQIRAPTGKYLGLAHVQSQTGELTDADEEATGPCFTYEINDVLFARLRPYLNKVYRTEMNGCCSPEFHVLRVRDSRGVLPDYLAAVLRSRLVLAQTVHMMTGNTHPRLANEDVVDLRVPIPKPEVQAAVADEVRRRRDEARRLRVAAAAGWQSAKRWFEQQLLEPKRQ